MTLIESLIRYKWNKFRNKHWKTKALFKTHTYTCIDKLKNLVLVYRECQQKTSREKEEANVTCKLMVIQDNRYFISKSKAFLEDKLAIWIEYNCGEITTLDLSHKAWTSSITHAMLPSIKTHTVDLLSDLEGVIKPH